MDTTQQRRSLTYYPAIVVAYFEAPQAAQAAIADLRSLGMAASDASIVTKAMLVAAPTTAAATSWLDRLRATFGRPPGAATPQPILGGPAPGLVLIVQAKDIPIDTIGEVCQRHGASKVDSRAQIDIASHGDTGSTP